jgi:dolichyl-phosphate beta-glucosyltransferase
VTKKKNDTASIAPAGPPANPFLSVIIPAFNEEKRLPATLDRVVTFLGEQKYDAEIVVVDNGSTDHTRRIVFEYKARCPILHYCYEPTPGKGAAVKAGIMHGKGDYVLLCDADLAVPIEEIAGFLPPRLRGIDVAIGSREKKGAKRHNEPFYRHLMGRIFNLVIQLFFLPGMCDTQCGFKCFDRSVARDLFASNTLNGWCHDVEILYIAKQRGYRISEIPVSWYFGSESKVKPVRDFSAVLRELREIRRNERRGVYKKKSPVEFIQPG